MADTLKALYRGSLSTTLTTTLYTVPASTTTTVVSVAVVNDTAAAIDVTVSLAGIKLLGAIVVPAHDLIVLDVTQPLAAGEVIAGGGSAAGLLVHIAGVETA